MKKNMTKTRELLVQELISALKEDTINWNKPWSIVHQVNAISNYEYHGVNRFYLNMIASQRGYKDPRWVTFNQIKDNQWELVDAKGKGVPVEFWSPYDTVEKRKITFEEAEKIKQEYPEEDRVKYVAKTYYVFNASLVKGIKEYKLENKSIKQENIMNFFKEYLTSENISYFQGGNKAYYVPSDDEIHLPDFSQFKNEESFYSTLAHEIAHSTGHVKRLDRDLSGVFGSVSYAKEELRAEISSCFICDELGIMNGERLNNNKAYVQNWIQILEKNPDMLFKAITDAEKITEYVLEKGDYEFNIENQIAKESEIEKPTQEKKIEVPKKGMGLGD